MSEKKGAKLRRRWAIVGVVFIGVVALAIAFAPKPTSASTQRTETVSTGDVSVSADASGTVVDEYTFAVAPRTIPVLTARAGVSVSTGVAAMGYKTSKIEVAVGDKVSSGEVIARAKDRAGTSYKVTAPAKGRVRSIQTTVGASASQVASIGTGRVLAAVEVSENSISKIGKGQKVSLTLTATGESFAGKVESIASASTTDSGVQKFQVLVSTDALPDDARIGMTLTASITIDSKSGVLWVSPSAVTTLGPISTVEVVSSTGKTTVTPVTLGLVGTTRVEISNGVKAGDKVVTGVAGTVPSSTTSVTNGPAGGVG